VVRFCGTPVYMSPEVIKCYRTRSPYDPFPSEVWSLGIILFIMYFGSLPWDDEDDFALMNKILITHLKFPGDFVDSPITDLLERLLDIDPTQRPSIGEILKHEWFADLDQ